MSQSRIPIRIPNAPAPADVWPVGPFDDDRIPVALLRRVKPPAVVSKVVSAQPFALAAAVRRQRRRELLAGPESAEFMSAAELVDWLGLSRSTLHRLKAAGDFPQPLQISRRRVAYRVAEVRAWLAGREQRVPGSFAAERQGMRA